MNIDAKIKLNAKSIKNSDFTLQHVEQMKIHKYVMITNKYTKTTKQVKQNSIVFKN